MLIWVAIRFEGSFKQSSRMYAQLALTDDLTKLGNHISYREDLRAEVARVRLSGVPLVLALIHVDELIARGEPAYSGDELLIVMLAAAFGRIRRHDAAYRVGGDDFALILRSTSLGEAHRVVRALHEDAMSDLPGARVSVGLAVASEEPTADQLHAEAEAALYDAKRRAGLSAIVAFSDLGTPGMISASKADALRALLGERAIDIAFQPIWDRLSHRLLGFEALARPAARLGFDGPADAFDVADALHMTEELGRALPRSRRSRVPTRMPPDALLFLNVSPAYTGAAPAGGLVARRLWPARRESIRRVWSSRSPRRSRCAHGPRHRGGHAGYARYRAFRLALDDTGAGATPVSRC